MKYSINNEPTKCIMTQSSCYKGTREFTPKGILFHSTGCNNPCISRYVQPDDNAENKWEMINMLGVNSCKNDWNHIELRAGVHGFLGKLQNGDIKFIQVLPWEYRPWGCGSGAKGTGNDLYLQFEICEDNLFGEEYFNCAYKEAIEISAYLCKKFGISPFGTIQYNGCEFPAITCHSDSCAMGIGSNHGDVLHWFLKHGKDMNSVRSDIQRLLDCESKSNTNTTNTNEEHQIEKITEEYIEDEKYIKDYEQSQEKREDTIEEDKYVEIAQESVRKIIEQFNQQNNKQNKQQNNQQNKQNQQSQLPKNTETNLNSVKDCKESKQEKTTKDSATSVIYLIYSSKFLSRKNAENMINKLRKAQLQGEIIYKNRIYTISLGEYSDYETAKNYLKAIRKLGFQGRIVKEAR